jgi:heme/copper-type cytochrome/quinol oxidase subunit 2
MRVSEIVLSPCCFAFVSFLLSFKESVYVLSPWEKDMVLHLQEFLFYFILFFFFIFFGVFVFLAVKIS